MKFPSRTDRSEAGFTLIELLVVLVVLPLIMGAVAAAVIGELNTTSQSDPHGTFVRLADSHDAQITSAYFVRDVQSASEVSAAPTAICGSTDLLGGQQLLGLEWTEGSATTFEVSYGVSATSPLTLVRVYCQGTNTPVVSTVSHELFPSTVTSPTVANTGTGQCSSSVSSCVYNGTTVYASVAVNCTDSTITCANSGLFAVLANPSTDKVGISSVRISVNDNQTTNYQYSLTGVPRLASSVASGGPNPGGPGIPPFIANGSVSGNNGGATQCQLLVNGQTAINDSSGTALNVGNSGSLDGTGVYTSGGTASGSNIPPVTQGQVPIESPYDQLTELSTYLAGNPSTVSINGTTYNVKYKTTNWSPSGTLAPDIYVVEAGMSVTGSTAVDGTGGALIYVTGGAVTLAGKGNISLSPLTSDWEVTPSRSITAINGSSAAIASGTGITSVTLASVPEAVAAGDTIVLSNGTSTVSVTATQSALSGSTSATISVQGTANATYTPGSATGFVQPLPQVVLWMSKNDISPTNPPTLTLGGNGGATTIAGAIYAPTTNVTVNGGGSAGSVNTQALDIGSMTCSGGGSPSHTDLTAGSPLSSATLGVPSPTSISLAQAESAGVTDSVTVSGQPNLAPTGYAWIYLCGPFAVEPASDPGCTSSTVGVQNLDTGNASLALTTHSTTGTSTASTTYKFPNTATGGWYCFGSYYSGDQTGNSDNSASYLASSDTTIDACFDVTPPPVVTITEPAPPNDQCYKVSQGGGTCAPGTWPATAMAGQATDLLGPGIQSVTFTLQEPSNGPYWSGTGQNWVAASTPVTATLTGPVAGTWGWTLNFPTGDFPVDSKGKAITGTYTLVATATDTSGTASTPVTVTFNWKG